LTRLAPFLALLVLAGCGGSEPRAARIDTGVTEIRCTAQAQDYRACDGAPTGSTIEHRTSDGGWTTVVGPLLRPDRNVDIGFWRSVRLSPDGLTLLAQWSGECEVPIAFFVDVGDRQPRPVTGERRWYNAPESIAVGWARDGRARVKLPQGACGVGAEKPGVYLVDPRTGRATFERSVAKP
jgi:hypothetical protein